MPEITNKEAYDHLESWLHDLQDVGTDEDREALNKALSLLECGSALEGVLTTPITPEKAEEMLPLLEENAATLISCGGGTLRDLVRLVHNQSQENAKLKERLEIETNRRECAEFLAARNRQRADIMVRKWNDACQQLIQSRRQKRLLKAATAERDKLRVWFKMSEQARKYAEAERLKAEDRLFDNLLGLGVES
jgi:hypothetical protein